MNDVQGGEQISHVGRWSSTSCRAMRRSRGSFKSHGVPSSLAVRMSKAFNPVMLRLRRHPWAAPKIAPRPSMSMNDGDMSVSAARYF